MRRIVLRFTPLAGFSSRPVIHFRGDEAGDGGSGDGRGDRQAGGGQAGQRFGHQYQGNASRQDDYLAQIGIIGLKIMHAADQQGAPIGTRRFDKKKRDHPGNYRHARRERNDGGANAPGQNPKGCTETGQFGRVR